jgi:hypothetical protein
MDLVSRLREDIANTNLTADVEDLPAADSAPDLPLPVEWTPINKFGPLPITVQYTRQLGIRQSRFLATKRLGRSKTPFSEKDNTPIPSNIIEPSASSDDKAISKPTTPERMSISFIVNPFDFERPTMVCTYSECITIRETLL